ncbi:MAG: NTP transferase domain-containing protein [Leptospirales bacterium]|nr:NTP transferase domain-containing protein [Leptospirales bacterium]
MKTGFVLAAGFGLRMGPLTAARPKPLLPVSGIPLIYYALFALQRAGCKRAVINLHYRGEMIERELRDFSALELQFTHEAQILGTAGGLRNAMESVLRHDLQVLLINPDVIFPYDLFPRAASADLLLRPEQDDARLLLGRRRPESKETGLALGKGDRVRFETDGDRYYLGCAAVLLSALSPLVCGVQAELGACWQDSARTGRLAGVDMPGEVIDAGSHGAYLRICDQAPYPAETMAELRSFAGRSA